MRALFYSLLLLSLSPALHALAIWEAKLPGGTYVVSLAGITSVSTHEYVVDGAIRVFELTVDTYGSAIGRFYCVEPVTPTAPVGGSAVQSAVDRAKEVAERAATRAGGNSAQDLLQTAVVKNYPTTTHARTVEYRLKAREDIEKLFKSVDAAWRTQREASIKVE